MRSILAALFMLVCASFATAQYYYKDLVVPLQTMQQLKHYKDQKVKNVKLTSFENDGEQSQGFTGEQSISNDFTIVTTYMKSAVSGESELKTYYNPAGQLMKTDDTTDGAAGTALYSYDQDSRLTSITNLSSSTGQSKEKEEHLWFYNDKGKPLKMLKIKDDQDTTYISFTLDDKENVAEEKSTRKNRSLPTVYYYYDANNRLTDIARYNQKAKRLLPDYIFEYNDSGKLASMLVVPEGSNEYQKWYYEYNAAGLKIKESGYNRRKQLLGRIEYTYQ